MSPLGYDMLSDIVFIYLAGESVKWEVWNMVLILDIFTLISPHLACDLAGLVNCFWVA
jgi:hypothetical protein